MRWLTAFGIDITLQIMKKNRRPLRGRDWSFLLLIAVVTAACVRLGFWQLERLEQRRDEIARIQARIELPPVELTSSEIDPLFAYRKAITRGRFDPHHQILLENQSLDGQAGFHLVTPLRFEDGGGLLIDRGWIPFDAGIAGELGQYALTGQVEVSGILKPSVDQPIWDFLADPAPKDTDPPLGTWRFLTVDLIQRQIDYDLAPLILAQTRSSGEGSSLPRPDPRVELDEGPHLGYAVQWFAFASIAVLGGGLWMRRQITRGNDGGTTR